jgi:hypothetical protein
MRVGIDGLGQMYLPGEDIFCFTRAFTLPPVAGPTRVTHDPTGDLVSQTRGVSLRYSAVVALGAYWLAEADQRTVLGGQGLDEFIGNLVTRVGDDTNLGDAALVAWAAAQAHHPMLAAALGRLRALDRLVAPEYVVEIAWVVAALAAARDQHDVEEYLAHARARLLDSVKPGSPVFPHVTGPGLVRGYRAHVACFADQVYPIQALARLHATADDPVALAAARACAQRICAAQGPQGQWWWHYDARTGDVIEGYPVYTVHQHAMAPMALFDLAEASGDEFTEPIVRGLRWIAGPAELGPDAEPMVQDEHGVTWRKVFRGDPRKLVRGLNSLTSLASPGLRVPGLDRVYRPDSIDRECRPYEFGWLFFAWLASIDRGPSAGRRVHDVRADAG